jgi:cytochrome c
MLKDLMQNHVVRSLSLFATCGLAVATARGPYTAKQADAGRTAYQATCASCHLADLGGRNEAPQLSGPNFMRAWGGRGAGALAAYIQASMPPGNRGGLSQEMGLDLAVFLLEANGGRAGARALTPATGILAKYI